MKDGSRFTYTARIAKGHPENPMTEEEVLNKFRANAKSVISEKQSADLVHDVQHLETIGSVRKLIELLVHK
jgi:2-methylcitrate dehydratase PrpD